MEDYSTTPKPEERKTGSRILLFLLIAALAVLAGIFGYNWLKTKEQREATDAIVVELSKERDATKAELEVYRGRNMQLDSLLEEANAGLARKSDEFDSLIAVMKKTGRVNANDIERARSQIRGLQAIGTRYRARFDSLLAVNATLRNENQGLQTTISEERTRAEQLTAQNTDLAGKVSQASVLKATDLKVTTYRVKNSGKEAEGTKAKNVDHMRLNFNVIDNKVARPGKRDVFMRIVDPSGVTMWVEDSGSGKFNTADGKESLYTARTEIDYANENVPTSVVFNKASDFAAGSYMVELYIDGFKVGETNFSLR